MIVKSPAGRMLLVAGVLVLALSACGRRGPPEPPPAATVGAEVAPAQTAPVQAVPVQAAPGFMTPIPGASEPAEDLQALPTTPDRPFILDGLL
jgi:predicted small lipoprotein YifL